MTTIWLHFHYDDTAQKQLLVSTAKHGRHKESMSPSASPSEGSHPASIKIKILDWNMLAKDMTWNGSG